MIRWTGTIPGTNHFIEELFTILEAKIQKQFSYTLEKVINATGTILHTNLGRARLSENAINHVVETARIIQILSISLKKASEVQDIVMLNIN